MPILQDVVMATVPSWEELSDVEKADRVAKRLLGPPKVAAGIHISIHAEENLWTGDVVVLDLVGNARKWNGVGLPSGIAIGPIGKGMFGWIQTKSYALSSFSASATAGNAT